MNKASSGPRTDEYLHDGAKLIDLVYSSPYHGTQQYSILLVVARGDQQLFFMKRLTKLYSSFFHFFSFQHLSSYL